MGIFHPFVKEKKVKFVGVEAAGLGLSSTKHAASLCKGSIGVLHGSKSFLLQTDDGQIQNAHSVSAGLDYPGVGPEHAYYKQTKRAQYVAITDQEALNGLKLLSQLEGIIPALESSHAIAYLVKMAKMVKKNTVAVVCLSGRGDKDMEMVSKIKGFVFDE
jgi:tryptophan synthase beta chain